MRKKWHPWYSGALDGARDGSPMHEEYYIVLEIESLLVEDGLSCSF